MNDRSIMPFWENQNACGLSRIFGGHDDSGKALPRKHSWSSLALILFLNFNVFKKKRNWVVCSEVDGPRVCHTEWSKSEREK